MSGYKKRAFSPFPKYLQLREVLRKRMLTDYEIGQRLPSEQELCAEFGVSRETVREALRKFDSDGVIARHRAQGTFLVRKPEGTADHMLTGHTEDFSALRLNTRAEVICAQSIDADAETAHLSDPNGQVFFIRRLRHFDNIPLAIHDAYMQVDLGRKLEGLDLRHTSILRELNETLNIACIDEREQIQATLATPEMATTLEVQCGAPLLLLMRHVVSASGHPLVLFKSYYRGDRYCYTLNLSDPRQRRTKPPSTI
jgi:GntR family transcriptional regulator